MARACIPKWHFGTRASDPASHITSTWYLNTAFYDNLRTVDRALISIGIKSNGNPD